MRGKKRASNAKAALPAIPKGEPATTPEVQPSKPPRLSFSGVPKGSTARTSARASSASKRTAAGGNGGRRGAARRSPRASLSGSESEVGSAVDGGGKQRTLRLSSPYEPGRKRTPRLSTSGSGQVPKLPVTSKPSEKAPLRKTPRLPASSAASEPPVAAPKEQAAHVSRRSPRTSAGSCPVAAPSGDSSVPQSSRHSAPARRPQQPPAQPKKGPAVAFEETKAEAKLAPVDDAVRGDLFRSPKAQSPAKAAGPPAAVEPAAPPATPPPPNIKVMWSPPVVNTTEDLDAALAEIAGNPNLPDPVLPVEPALPSHMAMPKKLAALQTFISSFEYNYTGTVYVPLRKDRGLGNVMSSAKHIIAKALPIQCIEAVFLGVYLTRDMFELDRIPVSFKSVVDGHVFRHIILAIRYRSKWGALGLSRKFTLMNKDLVFNSLSALLYDYKVAYESCWHKLVKVYIGLPFGFETYSHNTIKWRCVKVRTNIGPWQDAANVLDRYARDARGLADVYAATNSLSAATLAPYVLSRKIKTEAKPVPPRVRHPVGKAASPGSVLTRRRKKAKPKAKTMTPIKVFLPAKEESKAEAAIEDEADILAEAVAAAEEVVDAVLAGESGGDTPTMPDAAGAGLDDSLVELGLVAAE